MDELEIGGKKYISSKRAAREHRYHIDYVGQLIRGGKIIGKKIGRSWYVEDLSLKNYLRMESGLDPLVEEVEETTTDTSQMDTSTDSEVEEKESIAEITMKNIDISESKKSEIYTETSKPTEEMEEVFEEVAEVKKEFTVKPIILEKIVAVSEASKRSLNYMRDTEPLIPTLDRKVRENADFMPINLRKPILATPLLEETTEQVSIEENTEEVVTKEQVQPRKKGKFVKFVVLAVFITVLILGAAASSLLSTKINVGDEGTANVRLSLP